MILIKIFVDLELSRWFPHTSSVGCGGISSLIPALCDVVASVPSYQLCAMWWHQFPHTSSVRRGGISSIIPALWDAVASVILLSSFTDLHKTDLSLFTDSLIYLSTGKLRHVIERPWEMRHGQTG